MRAILVRPVDRWVQFVGSALFSLYRGARCLRRAPFSSPALAAAFLFVALRERATFAAIFLRSTDLLCSAIILSIVAESSSFLRAVASFLFSSFYLCVVASCSSAEDSAVTSWAGAVRCFMLGIPSLVGGL